MIHLQELSIAPGGEPLLVGANWHLRAGEKVGLVGRNGTGKTTLLKAIANEHDPSSGRIVRTGKPRFGYLQQQAVVDSSATVWEVAKSGMAELIELNARLEKAEAAVQRQEPESVEKLDRAMEAFRLAGGYAWDERIGQVLHGLGFNAQDWHRPCSTFSGGWQMRIGLSQLLLSEPELALLDEPTNHLDLHARTWLARHLANSRSTLVIVSHDRHLLDAVTNRIVEIRSQQLHIYKGNFTSFLGQRQTRIAQQAAAHERQQAEIARLQGFVDRFGAKATKASQAQSRQKRIDKMHQEGLVIPPEQQAKHRIQFAPAPQGALGGPVEWGLTQMKRVTMGWSPETPVLRDIDFTMHRGMRLAVIGPNGCGKSTFLHTLAQRIPALSGDVLRPPALRVGFFTQDLAADLPGDQSPLEIIAAQTPLTPPQQIRTILGAMGLSGEGALRATRHLSGGEKARVALASLICTPHHLLLLDEPTNHLDVETIAVLTDALQETETALVLVTHDRFLAEKLATHLLVIQQGEVTLVEGNHIPDLEESNTPTGTGDNKPPSNKEAYEERRRRQRRTEQLTRKVAKLETSVAKHEESLAALDDQLASLWAEDPQKAQSVNTERELLQQKVNALYTEWEECETELENKVG